jgi:hypothetical protein
MGVLEDGVEEFKKMPTAGKVALGGGAVAVVAIAIYMRSKSSSTTTPAASGTSSLSNLPATDLSGGTASGPSTPGSTSGSTSSGTPTPNPVAAFANLLSGTNSNGLLGSGATVYSAGNGQIYATQPGGISALLSSILPQGTKVFSGGSGRWWYQLPGSNNQYLLTSGAGKPQTTGIGQGVKTPSNALTIGAPTSSTTTAAAGQLPVTH